MWGEDTELHCVLAKTSQQQVWPSLPSAPSHMLMLSVKAVFSTVKALRAKKKYVVQETDESKIYTEQEANTRNCGQRGGKKAAGGALL